jgi:ATPase family associated with various cellular activities (AAA)
LAQYGFQQAYQLAELEIHHQLALIEAQSEEVLHVPILLAPVGVGKTSIARLIAHSLGLPLVKINCGECGDPTDVSGMPVPWRIKEQSKQEPYMEWVLNRTIHQACVAPALLFFDDIDKAPALVQGALLSVFGERTVRDRKLHEETVVMAAGNRVSDDVLARDLSESIRTRATVINMEARLSDFLHFAQETRDKALVHEAVAGFLRYRPEYLHKYSAEADRFPTPRGWVEASYGLSKFKDDATLGNVKSGPRMWKTIVALKCGEEVSHDFIAWYDICARVDVKRLLEEGSYELADVADSAAIPYAIAFAVTQHLNLHGVKKQHTGLAKYLQRIEAEQRVAFRTMLNNKARNAIRTQHTEAAALLMEGTAPLDEEVAC